MLLGVLGLGWGGWGGGMFDCFFGGGVRELWFGMVVGFGLTECIVAMLDEVFVE